MSRRAMMGTVRRVWRRGRRAVVALATLAAVGACAIGVPLTPVVRKSSAERYPCENHPCGCADAESCWRHCCCMTDAAKLAWAEQAGVTPPKYVIATAAREEAGEPTQQVAGSGCCSAKSKTCCSTSKACCSTASPTATAKAAPAAARGVRFVVLHAAMKCRGLTGTAAALPPSLPILTAEFFPPQLVRFEPWVGESSLYEAPCRAIPTPPPQGALA